VVVDRREGRPYDRIGSIQFAADGRVVYEAFRDCRWCHVVGKREGQPFDLPFEPPLLTADGSSLVFLELNGTSKKARLVACSLDRGERSAGAEYDGVVRARGAKNGSRLAGVMVSGGRQRVVSARVGPGGALAEEAGPLFDQVLSLDLSDDGAHLAYLARRGAAVLLVRDGVELPFPPHDMHSQTLVADDGRTFTAGVVRGRFFPVRDGRRDDRDYDGIKDPVFGRGSDQYAFVARRGDRHVVVVADGETPAYDMVVSPQFTPDGSRLVYRARQDGRRFAVVADARGRNLKEFPRFDMVWQPTVTPDGKAIAYGVKSGRELRWQVEPLP
jgi:hypothetical protein